MAETAATLDEAEGAGVTGEGGKLVGDGVFDEEEDDAVDGGGEGEGVGITEVLGGGGITDVGSGELVGGGVNPPYVQTPSVPNGIYEIQRWAMSNLG